MKIKMLTLDAGPDGVRRPGEIHDVPALEADALIAGGYAVKVDADTPVSQPKPRSAVKPRGRTATKPDADGETDEKSE